MTSHDIPRLLSVRQAQYSEPPEGAAGRLVAAGPRLQYCNIHILQKGFCGPGSLHSLLEEERPPCPWAPAGALAALMRGVALLLIKVSRAEYFLFHSSPKKRSPKQKPEKKRKKAPAGGNILRAVFNGHFLTASRIQCALIFSRSCLAVHVSEK